MPTTPNYGWITPTEFGDIDLWGGILNTAIDAIDAEMFKKLNHDGSIALTGNWDVGGTFGIKNLPDATVSGDAVHFGQLTNTWTIEAIDPTTDDQFIASSGGVWTAVASSAVLGLIGGQPADPALDDISGLSPATKGEVMVWDGANWKSLPVGTDGQVIEADSTAGVGVAWKDKSGFGGEYFHVQHQDAGNGGTNVQNTWTARPLTTVVLNQITGASLAADQITLPAGIYKLVGYCVFENTERTQVKIRNVTDANTIILGGSTWHGAGSSVHESSIQGVFTLAAEKVIEFQYFASRSVGSIGLGNDANSGEINVYADLLIEKIA